MEKINNLLAIIITVYNEKIENLPISEYAKANNNDDFYFCDNSTSQLISTANEAYIQLFKKRNVFYINNGGNLGLPKNFNKVSKETSNKWILLLDQDTKVPPSFFQELKEAISKNSNYDIFAPIILDESSMKVFSPCLMKGFRKKKYSKKSKNWMVVPVNSCTCFSKRIYDKSCGFDEKLFLDFVDFSFFKKCFSLGAKILILNENKIIQPFSGSSFATPVESVKKRFLIFLNDSRIYYSDRKKGKVIRSFIVFKRTINLTLHYHTFQFFKLLIREKRTAIHLDKNQN